MTPRQSALTIDNDNAIDEVFSAFAQALSNFGIDGLDYQFKSRKLGARYGHVKNLRASYHLYLSGHYLGDLKLFADHEIDETDLKQVEQLVSLLTLKLSSLLAS